MHAKKLLKPAKPNKWPYGKRMRAANITLDATLQHAAQLPLRSSLYFLVTTCSLVITSLFLSEPQVVYGVWPYAELSGLSVLLGLSWLHRCWVRNSHILLRPGSCRSMAPE